MAVNSEINTHTIVMSANFIVKKDDKYLLLKRSPLKHVAPNVFHPPGGKIDSAEDPLKAAQRELLEESGLTAKNISFDAIVTDIHPKENTTYKSNWLIFYFSGDYESGEVQKTDEGEFIWLTMEELLSQPMFPSFKAIVKNIFNPQIATTFARFEYDIQGNLLSQEITVCQKYY